MGWYGCGCGEVGVGVGMENPTPVQNFTYLEPDSIISSWFVQSVIFGQSLLNKLEGVGKCVWGSVCGCGAVGVVRWV